MDHVSNVSPLVKESAMRATELLLKRQLFSSWPLQQKCYSIKQICEKTRLSFERISKCGFFTNLFFSARLSTVEMA